MATKCLFNRTLKLVINWRNATRNDMIHLVSIQIGMKIHIFIQLDMRELPYVYVFNIIPYRWPYVSISSSVFVTVHILSHKTSLRHHNLLISLRILSRYLYIDDLVYVNSQIFVRTYTHRPASLPPIRYSLT